MTDNTPTTKQEEGGLLLPCPFCGGTDIRMDCHHGAGRGPYHAGENVWSMCCYNCGATFPNRYNRESLAASWNRRAPTTPLRGHVMPGDPEGLNGVALQWYLGFDFGQPHSVRESNIAIEGFKDGYRQALGDIPSG